MSTGESALIIDDVMPVFDAGIAEHVIVRADPTITFHVARELDFHSVHTPLVDAAMLLRGLPSRVSRQAQQPPPRLVLAAGDPLPGWLILGEQPERELAFGAVGKFWQPNIEWRDVGIDEFAAFAESGWGKIAAKPTSLADHSDEATHGAAAWFASEHGHLLRFLASPLATVSTLT